MDSLSLSGIIHADALFLLVSFDADRYSKECSTRTKTYLSLLLVLHFSSAADADALFPLTWYISPLAFSRMIQFRERQKQNDEVPRPAACP